MAREAAEQVATQAEQASGESDENKSYEMNSLQNAEEATENVHDKSQEVAEKASEQFECLICDFTSNWENGLKVHMARMHSKIDQIDGHSDQPDDEKYDGSHHYWKSGWLGGAFQSFKDAYEVIEECDIPEDEKKLEHVKLLDARKTALGASYSYFPPWSKS